MNLADINTVRKLLQAENFSFKKSLGQNFLINPDVCPAMAQAAADKNTGVIEIGPGIGVLTTELSKEAKKVVAIELDERLRRLLSKTLEKSENTEIIFSDAMKMDLRQLIIDKFTDCERVCVCANLPYYITSPIIMKLLESRLPIDSITVMVQKEAAERLCAQVGTRAAGAVSVAVSYYAESKILFSVGKESFMPPPKVDSCVIQLKIRNKPPINVKDEKKFFKFVAACFAQRRKTFINSVSNSVGIDKSLLKQVLSELEIAETVRSEELTMNQLCDIFNKAFSRT